MSTENRDRVLADAAGWAPWIDSDRQIHVVPTFKSGDVIPPHTINRCCVCVPRQEISKKGLIMWIHEHVN